MSGKREIFRHGRYEMCDVIYWPIGRTEPDYIIVQDSRGHELICHQAMGCWCEMTTTDLIGQLRYVLATLDHLSAENARLREISETKAWEILRPRITGFGKDHGDDHFDDSCERCTLIVELDAALQQGDKK